MRNGGIFRGFGGGFGRIASVFLVFSHSEKEGFEGAAVEGDEGV